MLMQMLQAQTEDEEPMPVIGWEEVLVFYIEVPKYVVQNTKEESSNTFFYQDDYSFRFSDTLIKPPMV